MESSKIVLDKTNSQMNNEQQDPSKLIKILFWISRMVGILLLILLLIDAYQHF